MNWFTRHFSKSEATSVTDVQLQNLTAQLTDKARVAALAGVREQFGVVHETLQTVLKENTGLRKDVFELNGTVLDLKKLVGVMTEGFEASVKKMENLHGSVSEDRKTMATALNTMNGRINDVMPATRARDASALIATLGKTKSEPATKSTLAGPR